MIDFRYHLVSLVAVFLALAVGVVLGTSSLKGPVLADLHRNVSRLTVENRALRGDITSLRGQTSRQQSFADEVAPVLLEGRLTGRSVAVLSTAGAAAAARDQLVTDLGMAGARVVAKVRLTDAFADPKRAADIKDLVLRVRPDSVRIPETDNAVDQAGTLLAAALVGGKGEVSQASRTAVLEGFRSLGLLTVDGDVTETADLSLLIVGAPVTGDDAKSRNQALLTLVKDLQQGTSRTVLAAPDVAGNGNAVAGVRGDGALAKAVSTVDNVGVTQGQLAAVLALADQAHGEVGHYGVGDGASALLPSLAR